MHLSEAFKLLKNKKLNCLEGLSTKEFKDLRRRVISMVLATDVAYHSKLIQKVNTYGEDFTLENWIEENEGAEVFNIQQDHMDLILHAADVQHPSKTFELSKRWTELLFKEFHNQGDIEKKLGLDVSELCDRKISISSSSIEFINNIVFPCFELVVRLLPKAKHYLDMIENTKDEWEKLNADENA